VSQTARCSAIDLRAVATNEPATVDDATMEHTETDASDAAPVAASGFPYDEQTLGRSNSVFDAGVDFTPAAVPPMAPAPQMYEPQAHPQRPLTARERRRRVKLEARRVRRIVRHVELWSVLKVSILFYICLWAIFMFAGLVLWSYASSSGVLLDVEELIESLFELDSENEFWRGSTIFKAYMVMTLALSIAGITFNVLLAALYNLISDLTGGVRFTVIEEESARFVPPRRRERRR